MFFSPVLPPQLCSCWEPWATRWAHLVGKAGSWLWIKANHGETVSAKWGFHDRDQTVKDSFISLWVRVMVTEDRSIIFWGLHLLNYLPSLSLFSGSNFLLVFEMFLVWPSEIRDDEPILRTLLRVHSHPFSPSGLATVFSIFFIRMLK